MEGAEVFPRREVILDEERHVYWAGDQALPSVTQILRDGHEVFYTKGSDTRGSMVHALTAMYDRGEIQVDDVPDFYRGYIQAWASFRKESGFVPEFIEEVGWDPALRYAGTIDRIGQMAGVPWTLDIKSGGAEKKHKLQLGGYYGLVGITDAGVAWSGANELAVVYVKPTGKYLLVQLREAAKFEAIKGFEQRRVEWTMRSV